MARLVHFGGVQPPVTNWVTNYYPGRDQNMVWRATITVTHSFILTTVLHACKANPRSPPSSPSKTQQKSIRNLGFFLSLREEGKRLTDFPLTHRLMTVYIFTPILFFPLPFSPSLPFHSLPTHLSFLTPSQLHPPSTPEFATHWVEYNLIIINLRERRSSLFV